MTENKKDALKEFFGGVIYEYSRQQAIEDGMLVDLNVLDESMGATFGIPCCLTNHLYGFLQVPTGLEGCQDFKGRLWDTVWMAYLELKKYLTRNKGKPSPEEEIIPFEVLFLQERGKPQVLKRLWLTFNKYEGLTLMFPEDR